MMKGRRSRWTPPPSRAPVGGWLIGAAAVGAGVIALSKGPRTRLVTQSVRQWLQAVIARARRLTPDDATLRERVEDAVCRHEPNRGKIRVRVESGTVVLHGELDSPDQVVAAEESARKVRGVRKVVALVSIPGTQKYRHVP